jgi:cytochrome c biogenesis protein CcmG, thiol:disulfide interchange protein DsbE
VKIVFAFAVALLLCACDYGVRLNKGDAAPGFAAKRLDGSKLIFPEELKGKPIAIHFWSQWCTACEPELKDFDTVYRRHKSAGLEVLAINAGERRPAVAAFAAKLNISYVILLDETTAVARRYGIAGVPTTFFISGDGVVQSKIVGEADEPTLEKHAKELLQETDSRQSHRTLDRREDESS